MNAAPLTCGFVLVPGFALSALAGVLAALQAANTLLPRGGHRVTLWAADGAAQVPAADGTRDGEFCAVELEDGSLGLSYVLLGDTLARLRAPGDLDALIGMPAVSLARHYGQSQGVHRTLGFAAVNALTRHLFDRAGFEPPPAGGSLGDLELQAGDHLGMVGLFPPLVKQVLETGARLTVIELRQDLAGLHREHPPPAGITAITAGPTLRLWERGPDDGLVVRLGTGSAVVSSQSGVTVSVK